MTWKRQIKGALDVVSLPKRLRGPNEVVAVLIPSDEAEGDAGPMNVACPRKVVMFVNSVIDSAQMELTELEQLPMKSADMEMWLCMKQALNATDQYRERFEDSRAKITEARKAIQDANCLAEENAAKIAELSSKLAIAERAMVEMAMETAKRSHAAVAHEAKMKAVADY
ncbi:unnamed protein product [Prunus brigantina]